MTRDPTEPPDNYEGEILTTRFDPEFQTPATAILEALEEHSGNDAADLPALGEHVDPDALNEFMLRAQTTQTADSCKAIFSYAGYWVIIRSDATVTVRSMKHE